MALTLSEKIALAKNENFRNTIWAAIVEKAIAMMISIPDPIEVTPDQQLALRFRMQAHVSNASVFVAASTWIAMQIDNPSLLGIDITYVQVEQALGDSSLDTEFRKVVDDFWPLLASVNNLEDSQSA